MPNLNLLLIVSHVIHYRHDGRLFAYGPYVREIDIWAQLFPQILIASPCRSEPPPGDCLSFTQSNIEILPQLETGGNTRRAKILQVMALPRHLLKLSRAMRQADAVHVRCPGNLGLLGCALAPLFARYRVAKYAGQWNGYENEPRSVRWQRSILRSRWWGQPVLVYGQWDNQPAHIVPFFTSMMTREMVTDAAASSALKTWSPPLRVLFSGRLETVKRIDALIAALGLLAEKQVAFEAVIAGGGSQESALKAQVEALGIDSQVRFTGALPYEQVLEYYHWAHCLVLPSQHSEGWPKAVAEAMCYGAVCVVVSHGHLPTMLQGRGILTPHGSPEEIAAALEHLADDPVYCAQLSAAAAEWAQNYSLDDFGDAVKQTLEAHWHLTVNTPRSALSENSL